MLTRIFQPSRQMIESLSPRDVVDQKGTGRPAIVRTRYRPERLLTGRVPNLQFDLFAVYGDHASPEFNTDRQVVHRLESLVRELQKQTRFADTWKMGDSCKIDSEVVALEYYLIRNWSRKMVEIT